MASEQNPSPGNPAASRVRGPDVADKSSDPGKPDQAKTLLGLLVAGFAGVLSFLGIRSTEVSAILRNLEPLVGFVAIAFFLGILAAVLSIYARPKPEETSTWPANGLAVASLLLIAAAGAALAATIRVYLVTTFTSVVIMWVAAGVLALAAVAVLLVPPRGDDLWRRRVMDRQLYFVLVSVLLLAVGGYTALRIESADQDAPFAQVSARVTETGRGTAMLTVTVDSAKIPAPDRVDIFLDGVPRDEQVAVLCSGVPVKPGNFSCLQDPCTFAAITCTSLGVWQLPPDSSGDVRQVIQVPLTLAAYQRIHINDQVCQRTSAQGSCAAAFLVGSHLDLQLPPEPPPGLSSAGGVSSPGLRSR